MIEFFRDTISGWVYYVYIAVDLLFIFALIGYIAEKKEKSYYNEKLNINMDTSNVQSNVNNNNINNEVKKNSNAAPPIITTPVMASTDTTQVKPEVNAVQVNQNDTIKQ